MSAVGESPEIDLLRRCFEAIGRGDFATLERALAKDARWRTVVEGSTNCAGRTTIIEIMSRNLGGRVRGTIEELVQFGSRVVVGFRPERSAAPSDRPLDQGIAYVVVTLDNGEIAELKGCASRSDALGYARTGVLPDPVPALGVDEP
jgi:ketosteroid isomerase-like protein